MGGGAAGWRMVAIVYAVIGLAVNTISVLAVKELPEEEGAKVKKEEKYSMREAAGLLFQQVLSDDLRDLYFTADLFRDA